MVVVLGAVALLAIAFAAAVVVFAQQQVRLIVESHRVDAEAWIAERRELLNRIQHPQIVPSPATEAFAAWEPDAADDALDQVGQIVIDPEYGMEVDA